MTQVSSDKEATAPATGQEAGSRAAAEAPLQQISRQARALSLVREASLLPAVILLIVTGAIISPVFFTSANLWGSASKPPPLPSRPRERRSS